MALADMRNELKGSFPKIPYSYLTTLVNRAYHEIRDQGMWSFQLFESSWATPPICTSGTVSVTQGSPIIQFDAIAVAAINASQIANPYSLITQRQFRIGIGGIYNLLTYNQITGAATLDRMYLDTPSGPGQTYQLYQLYYPAPFADFRTWLSVRNPIMFLNLKLTSTRKEIDAVDPQRLWYAWPTDVIPWGYDNRGANTSTPSATLNFPLFELWGQPVNPFTYQCYGIRNMPDLALPTDTLPHPLGEDIVLAKARTYAYKWAEANKDMAPRNQGPDFKFLTGSDDAEYRRLLILYRKRDMELTNNFYIDRGLTSTAYYNISHYNTLAGRAGPA